MTPEIYLETSSAIKLYKAEEGTVEVEYIIKRMLDGDVTLSTSVLTLPEILRGLRKAGADAGELSAVEKDFSNYIQAGLKLTPVTADIMNASLEHIKKHNLYVADAIHLASAKNTNTLITNDKHLYKKTIQKHTKNHPKIQTPKQWTTKHQKTTN